MYGEHLRQQVENRLKFYETGETPAKNADVMRQAEAEVRLCVWNFFIYSFIVMSSNLPVWRRRKFVTVFVKWCGIVTGSDAVRRNSQSFELKVGRTNKNFLNNKAHNYYKNVIVNL